MRTAVEGAEFPAFFEDLATGHQVNCEGGYDG